ncbi:U2 snRNP complex subunit [Malassezia cuniculi]|uniref:U2 small nuclear ribonucleoprotein A' n=1 Tax=Malassezia cuniculi TaxID=948313 RepID=A0AAF0EZQ9_9BASI|nr:U2 snRNP complex subunit [Malassezia cuniculi]
MKLTAELLAHCDAVLNPLRDHELDLRGLKVNAIENLGVTRDLNDTIDFTDNDIRYLGNFPLLKRLQHVTATNNHIARIDSQIHKQLPYLHSLTLTNNAVADFAQVAHLARLRRLEYLSLMGNPVSRKKHYREFVVWKVPSVRVLDYKRVTDRERQRARELMDDGGKPSALAKELLSETTVPDVPEARESKARRPLTEEERSAIERAIERAQSLEEIRRLEDRLRLGYALDTLS